ncbi:MAG: arginine--tRNA ligase [Spirochaetes bacterium]|nr:arginine--tRNA ligase [Spirochaetota bacterium]
MTLRYLIRQAVTAAARRIAADLNNTLPEDFAARIDYTPALKFGHYATPVAMELAKVLRQSPRAIAQKIVEHLVNESFSKVEIAGAGFINITLSAKGIAAVANFTNIKNWLNANADEILTEKIIFEYVSANPTGPMNIVSARAASVGDSITRVLGAVGNAVFREYYVNDYGNQVEKLGLSFAYRYLQKFKSVALPDDCYQGEYIIEYLDKILANDKIPENIFLSKASIGAFDEAAWLKNASAFFAPLGVRAILKEQQKDLQAFRTEFDNFFSEASLHAQGAVMAVGAALAERGKTRSEDGAQIFVSTTYGDDKDRVIVRSDGRPTYLLADIAYHADKVARGFKKIIDIWGPDHHGYIARLSGALRALGFGDAVGEEFKVIIAQQVNLLENGEPVVMSKRLGKFQTMRDLLEKIPIDVCRWFFVQRALSTHLDFDLTLALDQSKKNPVYYVQYAHARIHSIFREANYAEHEHHWADLYPYYAAHSEREELYLFLLRFPELLQDIARNYEIQRLPEYLYQVATLFTHFYHGKNNRIKDLQSTNAAEAAALLALCALAAQVLEAGLSLLGISAPQEMHRNE